jgi:hypothetical protein
MVEGINKSQRDDPPTDQLDFFHERDLQAEPAFPSLVFPLSANNKNPTRVARWFVFKPKIPSLVKFGGPWNRKCCYIL